MSLTAKRERAKAVYAELCTLYPEVRATLDYRTPLQLLIMTMLAAQCTDVRVNIVAKPLFRKYKKAQDFANANVADVAEAIHSTGFFRQKAKNIAATCKAIVEEHGGEVPDTMDALLRLPGVGRKTANVILGECFGGQGVIVDTHCSRIARRLGFTKHTEPEKIERALMKVWPEETWTLFSHRLVFHGRALCMARAPRCSQCPVAPHCPFPKTREGKRIAK